MIDALAGDGFGGGRGGRACGLRQGRERHRGRRSTRRDEQRRRDHRQGRRRPDQRQARRRHLQLRQRLGPGRRRGFWRQRRARLSAVDEDLVAYLCPGETFNYKDLGRARDSAGNLVRHSSRIEKIQGGSGNDLIYGCGANNTLSGGGNGGGDLLSGFNGQIDVLADLGGCNQKGINLPASDDVYAGFMGGSATWVLDTGGKGDVVNLGNFSSKSVRMTRVDIDKDGTKGSLRILFDDTKEHGLLIINQFEPMRPASWPGAT